MNGEKRRRHGRSIRRRLLVPICLLLTVQVAVLIGGVYFSGLLERMDENAYAVLDQCCFSKRMRKVFKKNEKSMLQFCNKNSKKKRAFTMG